MYCHEILHPMGTADLLLIKFRSPSLAWYAECLFTPSLHDSSFYPLAIRASGLVKTSSPSAKLLAQSKFVKIYTLLKGFIFQ
ncbi:hypothetical protein DPMN_025969 [Dreissena polymorpha]|uniref:Uncharacterized protein n=1 Tax=Dreissena polymorpha TaxID=45954 RepID=A0A9D4RD12_DREPO|nr:hypothetical protein DPMN_025969 [Dreissena polymorpha]